MAKAVVRGIGQFLQGENVRKILANFSWLISGKLIQLVIGLPVSILVARSLGPSQFGILSYAASLVAFFGSFVYLGLSGLVVRDLVENPDKENVLLGTTFCLKSIGAAAAVGTILLIAWFNKNQAGSEFWVLFILGLGLFATPFEVVDFWFESQINSKYSVVVKTVAFLLGAALKVLFVLVGLSVVWVAAASSLQLIMGAGLLAGIFSLKGNSFLGWKVRLSEARRLLSQSWILILASSFAVINLKADQVMLRWIAGPTEVGVYAVAVTLSETWYLVPAAVVASVFPRLIGLKKNSVAECNSRIQQTLDILFVGSFLIACITTLVAGPLIDLLYGEQYLSSGLILKIHIWAGVFMCMQHLINKWVLMEGVLYFHLINHAGAAVLNILLNMFLIPQYGGVGAAFATLISYAASSYLFLFLYPPTRQLARGITVAFLLPPRVIVRFGKLWSRK